MHGNVWSSRFLIDLTLNPVTQGSGVAITWDAGLSPDAVQLERGKPLAAVRNLAHNALRPEAIESFWCAHTSSSHMGLLLLCLVHIIGEGYC